MLDVLGLDAVEETVYRRLVGAPSATLAEVAEVADLDKNAAAAILSVLEGKGLVARATAGQDRYVASPPAVAPRRTRRSSPARSASRASPAAPSCSWTTARSRPSRP